jgi:multidrug resistance protein, MATE family
MIFSHFYKKEYKKNLTLAYPVVLSQLGHILVGVADSIMVGRLGVDPLGAISLANGIFTVILVFGLGISFSITPLIAIAESQQNYTRIALFLINGMLANMLIGVALFLAGFGLSPLLAYLSQPEEVVRLAIPFINVLFLSMVPLMYFQAYKQFTEGLSLTKPAMYISVFSNVLNILLNYLLIYGKLGFPELGMMGAAWATLISRVVMALMMSFFVMYARRFYPYRLFFKAKYISVVYMARIYRVGLPIAMQMVFEVGAFSFSAIMMGWISAHALAAHQIALSIAAISYMMASGIAAAATIRVGNAFGKKKYTKMRSAGLSSVVLVVIFMSLSAGLMIGLKDYIPLLYIKDEITEATVISIASGLLIIAALFQISDGIQVVCLGALRGLEDVRYPGVISLLAYWVVALPLGYFCCFVLKWGPYGIWTGLLVGLSIAAGMLLYRFIKLTRPLNER